DFTELTGRGGQDAVIAEFETATGDVSWVKNLGGTGLNYFYGAAALSNGGFAALGIAGGMNGDFAGLTARGGYDVILARYGGPSTTIAPFTYARLRDAPVTLNIAGKIKMDEANSSAALKWFRESVNNPAAVLTDGEAADATGFDGYYSGADSADKGEPTFNKDIPNSDATRSAFNGAITADQNARYWVLTAYTDSDASTTVYEITHYDVKNIFTSFPIWMRGEDETPEDAANSRPFEYTDVLLAIDEGTDHEAKTGLPFDLQTGSVLDKDDFASIVAPYEGVYPDVVALDAASLSAAYKNAGLAYDEVELYPGGFFWENFYAWTYTIGSVGTAFGAGQADNFPTITLDGDLLDDSENLYCEPTAAQSSTAFNPQHYIAHYIKGDVYKRVTAQFVDADGDPQEVDGNYSMEFLVPINADYYEKTYENGTTDYEGTWDSGRFLMVGGGITPPTDTNLVPYGWYVASSAYEVPDPFDETNNGDFLDPQGDLSGKGGYVRQDSFYGANPLLRVDSASNDSEYYEDGDAYSLTDNDVFYIVYGIPVQKVTSRHMLYDTSVGGYDSGSPETGRENPDGESEFPEGLSRVPVTKDYGENARGNYQWVEDYVVVGAEAYYLDDDDAPLDFGESNRVYIDYKIINHSDEEYETDINGGSGNFTMPEFKGKPWESQDAFFGIKIVTSVLTPLAGKQIFVDFYYEADTSDDGIPRSQSVATRAIWRDKDMTGTILKSDLVFTARAGATVYVPNDAASVDDLGYDYDGSTFVTTGFGDAEHTLQYDGHSWKYYTTHVGATEYPQQPWGSDTLTAGAPDYIYFDYDQAPPPSNYSPGTSTPKPEPEPEPEPEPTPDGWFIDVAQTAWYYEDIKYVFDNGLMVGTGADTFSPNEPMTRGMLVTVLGRMHGADVAGRDSVPPFGDVDPEKYYAPYIAWAAENGLVLGVGENRFEPDRAIKREELAVVFTRYMAFAELNYAADGEYRIFADEALIDDYAKDAIQTLNKLGIILGVGGNAIDPQGQATRAQVAAALHRFAAIDS
ncbi:MAG: S-layer homology domain-containing protein, partial [Oscillospiraceae bacterium]|nr:S-layer homology domain-containing protein [Oscillospiraceae bacterium]